MIVWKNPIRAGCVVYLLDEEGRRVSNKEDTPILYQVVSVYKEREKVSLVTEDGEYVGAHQISNVVYVSDEPIFKKSDYEVGKTVVWIDNEDIYEGTIDILHDTSARVIDIKKLMPVDYVLRIPYWKIPEGRKSIEENTTSDDNSIGNDLNKGEILPMSTKANIVIRNEITIRREIYLYQHSDAHPNNMTLVLAEMLRDIYIEFKELGDVDWFLNPSKLASFLVVKSVPSTSEDIKELMMRLPDSARYQLESHYFLGMPSLLVENNRVSNCNYDYIITLSESVEDNFFGYELEVQKMNSNKLVSVVMKHKENLLKEKAKSK